MSIFDVTTEQKNISELQWCTNGEYNLTKTREGVGLKPLCAQWLKDGTNFLSTKKNAENLIKALQKAIDLGWIK